MYNNINNTNDIKFKPIITLYALIEPSSRYDNSNKVNAFIQNIHSSRIKIILKDKWHPSVF